MKSALEIKREIINTLRQYPVLNSSEIKVDVIANIAWLSGKVNRYYKKYAIKEAVKNIAGIKHFRIDVYVDLSKQKQQSDEEIKNAILNKLSAEIPGNTIIVKVTEGIVIFSGTIVSEDQRSIVLKSIFEVHGILNVWDFIKVNSATYAIPKEINLLMLPKAEMNTEKRRLEKIHA